MEGPQSKSREFDQFRLISSDFIADRAVGFSDSLAAGSGVDLGHSSTSYPAVREIAIGGPHFLR